MEDKFLGFFHKHNKNSNRQLQASVYTCKTNTLVKYSYQLESQGRYNGERIPQLRRTNKETTSTSKTARAHCARKESSPTSQPSPQTQSSPTSAGQEGGSVSYRILCFFEIFFFIILNCTRGSAATVWVWGAREASPP